MNTPGSTRLSPSDTGLDGRTNQTETSAEVGEDEVDRVIPLSPPVPAALVIERQMDQRVYVGEESGVVARSARSPQTTSTWS